MKHTSLKPQEPDRERIALSVRQPWAELILRGIKTLEIRSSDTRVRGTIYLYTSKILAPIPAAQQAIITHGLDADALIRGRLVGTVDIQSARPCTNQDASAACVPASLLRDKWAWELANPQRLDEPLPVRFPAVWCVVLSLPPAQWCHRITILEVATLYFVMP